MQKEVICIITANSKATSRAVLLLKDSLEVLWVLYVGTLSTPTPGKYISRVSLAVSKGVRAVESTPHLLLETVLLKRRQM